MKVFLDTNIFLEFLLGRQDFRNAYNVFKLVEIGQAKGFVAEITLNNIWYVAKRAGVNSKVLKKLMLKIIDNFQIISVNNAIAKTAILNNIENLEDELQMLCAKQAECDFFITKDLKDFSKIRNNAVKVVTPYKFLNSLLE